MRGIAAKDERTSAKTLTRLAKSADDDVRRACAANPRTPAAALEMLAHDREPVVRASAARNPRLPEDALGSLPLDSDIRVRSAALKNPSSKNVAADQTEVTSNPGPHKLRLTPVDLQEMATNKRAEVRIQAAYHHNATPGLLAFLGGERRSVQVRRVVAANPNTPPEVLRSLADDKDADVRRAVAFNSATPSDALAELVGRSIDLALLVAMNPDAPIEILNILAADIEPLVRLVAMSARTERMAIRDSPDGETPIGDPRL